MNIHPLCNCRSSKGCAMCRTDRPLPPEPKPAPPKPKR